MNSPRLMTKSEFAVHRGVGKSAVSNWNKAKLLVFAEDPADGSMKIDVDRSEARLNAKIDPARGRPTKATAQPTGDLPLAPTARPETRGDSLADVRTDLIKAQTVKAQLDNAKRAGELVLLEDYARRASEFGRVARDRMHAMIRSEAERLASEKDPRQIVAIAAEAIDRAFTDLADQIASGQVSDDVEESDDAAVEAEVAAALVEGEGEDDEREAG